MEMKISGIKIDMPSDVKVSIFTDNDLTHINNDHFEKNPVARLLNQIHVPVPPPGYDYDNSHANVMNWLLVHMQVQLLLQLCFIHSMNIYSIITEL